jgi:hypothetical protein
MIARAGEWILELAPEECSPAENDALGIFHVVDVCSRQIKSLQVMLQKRTDFAVFGEAIGDGEGSRLTWK